MNRALPSFLRPWTGRPSASIPSMESGDAPAPAKSAAMRLPALAPMNRPAGLPRRWVAYVLDLALSLIFTFGWAAGVLLFVFLVNTLLDMEIWTSLRYGQNVFLTVGLFVTLFAIPYAGYYILPLYRTGRTAGFFFLHLRMVRRENGPGTGRERNPQRLGFDRAILAALPALLAGVVALSLIPDATDRPTTPDLLDVLRLPTALTCAFLLLTQAIDRCLRRNFTLGIHERAARVHVLREPRLRELMERERRVTEAHIAGGMAHEIRNALGTARLQLDRVAGREISSRTQRSLEDILNTLTESAESAGDREALKRAVSGVRQIYEDTKLHGHALREVSAAVDRGLGITRRVMDYSKIQPAVRENGQSGGLVAPAEPNALLSGLAESYREALAGEGIELRLDLGAVRPIAADAGQCYSVFQNLLLNARDAIREKREKAGPSGNPPGASTGETKSPAGPLGKIRISTGDGEQIWVRFADDGAGIPAEDLERVFDPFFSTKPSLGMGLGLNECRRIVDLYGGEIRVESEAGRGTQFTVTWPAAGAAAPLSGRQDEGDGR